VKNLLVFVIFIILGFNLSAQSNGESIHDHYCNKARNEQKYHDAMLNALSIEDLSFDLKYYRLEWKINPAVYAIDGKACCYFQAKKNGLDILNFNLSTQLKVSEIVYHGSTISFTQTGTYDLTVQLPSALPIETLDSLTIIYAGVPPSGGFGSFIQSSHNNTPIIWTLSEPFGAQDWWPCKNGLTDKVDSLDVIVTTPDKYRVASNGLLVSETQIDSFKIFHWKHQYAIAPYLIAIAVTNYEQYVDIVPLSNGTQLPMLNYVYPEDLQAAKQGTQNLIKVLQFYDSLFVTYPFYKEKYGHAQFGWGGGMEHQTMSFVINYNWGLLAHELAHQWFGDMVTCGSWEDIWLNEGFATFLEGLTRQRFLQESTWWDWRINKINYITSVPNGSVKVDDTTSVGRIFNGRLSYDKGSYLLHMLRWKLGDEAFFRGVRSYLHETQFNFAHTHQLQANLEQASGQNLDEYFKDWFTGQGYPSYQVNWNQNNSNQLFVQLNQTTSDASVSFFEMPVPVLFSGEGRDTLVRFDHHFSGESFTVPLDFKITSVKFDPDLWLLSANNTVNQVTSVHDQLPEELIHFQVSPNPSNENFVVTLELKKPEKVILSLINATGNIVTQQQLEFNSDRKKIMLQKSNLTAGNYFVRLQSTDWQYTKKLILN